MARPRNSLCHAPDCPGQRNCTDCRRLKKRQQRQAAKDRLATLRQAASHIHVPYSRARCDICGARLPCKYYLISDEPQPVCDDCARRCALRSPLPQHQPHTKAPRSPRRDG